MTDYAERTRQYYSLYLLFSMQTLSHFRFIAAHALFGSAWEICLVLVHIEPAFPAPVVMLGGVLQNFVPRDGFQYAVVNYALVCLGGAICSVIAMFVQR